METTSRWPVKFPETSHVPSEKPIQFSEIPNYWKLDNKENMASPTVLDSKSSHPLADRNTSTSSAKETRSEAAATRLRQELYDMKSYLVEEDHIKASPYIDTGNLLDLRRLSTPNRFLALALTFLEPTREDYATAPYLDSFNWHIVFHMLRHLCRAADFEWHEQEFHIVIFRSVLKEGADRKRLGVLDQNSHAEACASGGLLKYWFGKPDDKNRNLATCTF